jgi:hypothetical protein
LTISGESLTISGESLTTTGEDGGGRQEGAPHSQTHTRAERACF